MKMGYGIAKRWRTSRALFAVLAGAFLGTAAMFSSPAFADDTITNCGAPINSIVKTKHNIEYTTHSGTFVTLANSVVNIPAGQTQCVRVRFSATASCAASGNDHCYLKAYEASILSFDPASIVFTSDPTISAHSFEWASRLSAGSHTIQIQAATNNNVVLTLYNWSLSVETAK